MTSAEREVDVEGGGGGGGPHSNNALDFVIEHSNDSKDPRHSDVDLCKLTVCFAVIITKRHMCFYRNMPMNDSWLLVEGGGCIFQILLPTTHVASFCTLTVILQYPNTSCHVLAYAITANDVCLHFLVPPLAQYCFFSTSCLK